MVISIKVDTKNVMNMFRGYERTIPAGARRGAWLVALKMQGELRREIQAQGLVWRGRLLNKTRARKLSKNVYGVFMPFYGEDLDKRSPRWVSLKRGRLITQWAKEKGIKAKSIRVRKHPFIDRPVSKVRKKARQIVQREINKAIRRKGR